jgi:hypothetical protein
VLSLCRAIHLALGVRGLAGLAGLVTFARLRSLDQRPVWLKQRTGASARHDQEKTEQKTRMQNDTMAGQTLPAQAKQRHLRDDR